jgi:hypothetical protein
VDSVRHEDHAGAGGQGAKVGLLEQKGCLHETRILYKIRSDDNSFVSDNFVGQQVVMSDRILLFRVNSP